MGEKTGGPRKEKKADTAGVARKESLGKPPMGGFARKEVPHGPKSGFLEFANKKQTRRTMEQKHHLKRRGGGKHFTWEERVRLEALDRALYPGKKRSNISELARQMGRHRSSVSREYKRGMVTLSSHRRL